MNDAIDRAREVAAQREQSEREHAQWRAEAEAQGRFDEPVAPAWVPPRLREREQPSGDLIFKTHRAAMVSTPQPSDPVAHATLQSTIDGLADVFVAREFLDNMLHFLATEMGKTEERAKERQNDAVGALRAEIAALRTEVAELRGVVDALQTDLAGLADDLGDVERAAKVRRRHASAG